MSQRPIDDPSAEAKGTFARYWDGRAPSFDSQPQHTSQSDEETDAWKAILVKLSGGVVGTSALEVGTETGFIAILLAKIGHRVTGIDISTGMLAQAREKASELGLAVDFREVDGESTGYPDEAFDLVVSRHVIWNLPNPEVAVAE